MQGVRAVVTDPSFSPILDTVLDNHVCEGEGAQLLVTGRGVHAVFLNCHSPAQQLVTWAWLIPLRALRSLPRPSPRGATTGPTYIHHLPWRGVPGVRVIKFLPELQRAAGTCTYAPIPFPGPRHCGWERKRSLSLSAHIPVVTQPNLPGPGLPHRIERSMQSLSLPACCPLPHLVPDVVGCPPEQKVQIKFDIGEMAIDYTEIAKKDHLDNLSLEVRKLRDKLNDIHQNQEYQKVGQGGCCSWWGPSHRSSLLPPPSTPLRGQRPVPRHCALPLRF